MVRVFKVLHNKKSKFYSLPYHTMMNTDVVYVKCMSFRTRNVFVQYIFLAISVNVCQCVKHRQQKTAIFEIQDVGCCHIGFFR